MKAVAEFMSSSLHLSVTTGQAPVNISSTDRFAIYKVGPVLTVSVRIHSLTRSRDSEGEGRKLYETFCPT